MAEANLKVSGPPTWKDISSSREYISLSPDEKESARRKYFQSVVAPTILSSDPKADLGAARQQFDDATLPSAVEYQKEQIKRGMGNVMNMGGMSFLTPEGRRTKDFARTLGYQGLQPPNKAQQYLGGVTEFGTEAAMMAPWMLMGGQAIGPKAAAGIEAASVTAGGLLSEYGGDVSYDLLGTRAPGEFVGSLGGLGTGFLGIGGSRAARKGAGAFKDRQKVWDRMTRERIGRIVNADQQYIDNIIEADTIAKKMQLVETGPPKPGQELSDVGFNLAQATDSPGVKSLYQIYEKSTPEKAQAAMLQQRRLEDTLESREAAAFPPGKVTTEEAINQELLKTQREGGLLSKKITRQDPQKIGDRLKTIRDNKARMVKDQLGGEYDALYYQADQEGLSFDMTDVGAAVTRIFGDDAQTFQRPEMPSALSQIYSKYVRKPTTDLPKATTIQNYIGQQQYLAELQKNQVTASFEEVHSLWKRVNNQLDTYSRRGDDNAVRVLTIVKQQLRSKLDSLAASGSDLGDKFNSLNARYATEYADIYKKGAGGKLARFNKFGDTTKDEDVVRTLFFSPDKTTAVDDFLKIYGDDAEAMSMLRGGALDIFAKAVINKDTGLVDQGRVAKFMKDYELVLSKLPALKKELSSVSTMNAAITERMNFYQHLADLSDKTRVGEITKNSDVDRLMSFLVTDNAAMKRLADNVAMRGAGPEFARSLARHIRSMPNGYEYLVANEKVLKPLFNKIGKGHYDNLRTVIEGWAISQRAVPTMGAKAEPVEDWLRKRTGTTMDSLFSQYRAAQQGRTSFKQIGATIGAKWLTKFGFDSMFEATEKALFDPDLAATLARITEKGPLSSPEQYPALSKALGKHLITAGIRSGSQLAEPGATLKKEMPREDEGLSWKSRPHSEYEDFERF